MQAMPGDLIEVTLTGRLSNEKVYDSQTGNYYNYPEHSAVKIIERGWPYKNMLKDIKDQLHWIFFAVEKEDLKIYLKELLSEYSIEAIMEALDDSN